MRFDGQWMANDSGVVRPLITGAVIDDAGVVHAVPFLIDTGAEITVLSYDVVALLGVDNTSGYSLESITGAVPSVTIATTLWFLTNAGQTVPFNGKFGGCPDPATSDMSLLGRDVLRELAAIIDRPGNIVCLLSGRHRYIIQES